MAQEEKPQEPLKTPCRHCKAAKDLWRLSFDDWPPKLHPCPTCKGSGYEEKP